MKWSRCPACNQPKLVIARHKKHRDKQVFVVRIHKSPWPARDHFAEKVVRNAFCPGSGRTVLTESVRSV